MFYILLIIFALHVQSHTFPDREIFPCVVLPLATPDLRVEVPNGSPWLNSNLTAVMLESRDTPMLISAISSALSNFPERTRIQLFHSTVNARTIYQHFLPLISSGKIVTTMLSCDRFEVDSVTTSAHFWRAVVGEQVVIFQLDGTLCGGGRARLEEYLAMGFDYIGAPWAPRSFVPHTRSPVGNGGFSLRTRSTHLAVVLTWDYSEWYARGLRDSHITGWSLHEDLYFAHYLPAVGGRVAPAHIAQGFSVETVYHPNPVGAHAFWKHAGSLTSQQVTHLLHHCPELIPHWTKDTSPTFSFDLIGLDGVVASARAGYGVGAMPQHARYVDWRRDLWGGVKEGKGVTLQGAKIPTFLIVSSSSSSSSSSHQNSSSPVSLSITPNSQQLEREGSGLSWSTAVGYIDPFNNSAPRGGFSPPPSPPPPPPPPPPLQYRSQLRAWETWERRDMPHVHPPLNQQSPLGAGAAAQAAKGQKIGAGGAGGPSGSMTMGWRVGAPVFTVGSWGGAEDGAVIALAGSGVALDVITENPTVVALDNLTQRFPPSSHHWHSSILALPPPPRTSNGDSSTRGGSGHPPTPNNLFLPFHPENIPAVLLTLGSSALAWDWKLSAAAWSSVPGLRWTRLPCLPSEHRQKFYSHPPDMAQLEGPPRRILPILSPSLLLSPHHGVHNDSDSSAAVLPWWLPLDPSSSSSSSPSTWPADLGASEDTALRQLGGVVGVDKGNARISLLVGPWARPGESAKRGGLSSLALQKGFGKRGTPLRDRKDWDVVILSPLQGLLVVNQSRPSSPPQPQSSPGATFVVFRPPEFSGLLEVIYHRPNPPKAPAAGDSLSPTQEELIQRWSGGSSDEEGVAGDVNRTTPDALPSLKTWQPSAICPTPFSLAGPRPAYFVRPSLSLLNSLNGLRKLSTLNVETVMHPSLSPNAAARSTGADFYKDHHEPYGVLPWLCAWPGVRILVAEHPLVSADAGVRGGAPGWLQEGDGRYFQEEEEVEFNPFGEEAKAALEREAEFGSSQGWPLGGGGLAASLGKRLDEEVALRRSKMNPSDWEEKMETSFPALLCTRSLEPSLCTFDFDFKPPPQKMLSVKI